MTIETTPVLGPEQAAYKIQVILDTRRGLVPTKRQKLVKETGSDDWVPIDVLELAGYHEVAQGFQVPSSAVFRTFRTEPGKRPREQSTVSLRLDKWVFNVDPPASTFDLEFPSDILVNDEVSGDSYRTTTITDEQLRDRVSKGLETARGLRSRRLLGWAGITVLLLGVLGGAWLLRHRRLARRAPATRGDRP